MMSVYPFTTDAKFQSHCHRRTILRAERRNDEQSPLSTSSTHQVEEGLHSAKGMADAPYGSFPGPIRGAPHGEQSGSYTE